MNQREAHATQSAAPQGAERRDFFRIYQDVLFDYKPVSAETAEQSHADEPFHGDISTHLAAELKRLSAESEPVLKLIKGKNKALAGVLERLNDKVDLIIRHHIFASLKDQTPTQVNLSESGIAFRASTVLEKNSFVALRMLFIPSRIPVLVFGRIVRCEPVTESDAPAEDDKLPFKVAAKFHKLSDLDRRELERQIANAKAQSQHPSPHP